MISIRNIERELINLYIEYIKIKNRGVINGKD